MNIEYIDGLIMPIITVACLCIGFVLKKWLPTDDKWIPTILFLFGAASGLIVCGMNYEGVVKGAVSGLAAVGLHQAFKQHLKLDECDKIQTRFNADTVEELYEEVEDETDNKTTEE